MKFPKSLKVILLLIGIPSFAAFVGFVACQKDTVILLNKWKTSLQGFFAQKTTSQNAALSQVKLTSRKSQDSSTTGTLELIVTAKITTIKGRVEMRSPLRQEWTPVTEGTVLKEGDIVKANKEASSVIVLTGEDFESSLFVYENSQVMFLKLVSKENGKGPILLDLAEGKLIVTTSKINTQNTRFEIKTPTSIVNVEQGSILVTVEAVKQ